MASLIRFKIKKLAKLYIIGAPLPDYCAITLEYPLPLAHPEIDCIKDGFEAAIAFNLSSNFSQTLGTARNIVGRHQVSVSTKVP